MYSIGRTMYTILLYDKKSYWNFSIGYVVLLLLIFVIWNVYEFSATTIVLTISYIFTLWIITVWITVGFLRRLFRENKFINWKLFENIKKSGETSVLPEESSIPKLSENIETQFVKYWYNEISKDEKFSSESKILIENSLIRISDVLLKIDKTHSTYVLGNIYLKHLKEFRRVLRVNEKNEIGVSRLYRLSFPLNTKSEDFYIHQLTKNSLINFVHWELWNSIPCQIVVSIIARKLSYLLNLCSKPEFLNYHLLNGIISKQQKLELELENYSFIKISIPGLQEKTIFETVIKEREIRHDKNVRSVTEKDEDVVSDHTKAESKKETSSTNGDFTFNENENPVKIYEPKSATKTWNEVFDLDSITLGEDPLGSLMNSDRDSDGPLQVDEIKISNQKNSHFNEHGVSSANNLNKTLDEMKHMTSMEGLKNTMKPFSKCVGDATASTLRDFKDFRENTVNTVMKPMSQATSQALHKIGDLQDEAAGVVEGLFDFGMAGIRKGLKLTGLQENSSTINVDISKGKASPNVNNGSSKKVKRLSTAEIAEEFLWVNPLQTNPSFEDEAVIESVKVENVPSILMDSTEFESPDPEYEETADLATTIARLRSLLQQKSSESTATTPIASPMVSEDKSVSDIEDVDSFVPNLYKLCAKTATGVFNNTLNTLKTALPVNASEIVTYDVEQWDHKEFGEKEFDQISRMKRLLYDRKDFCAIETAYDVLDSHQPLHEQKRISEVNFQDDLDDFESEVPLAKTLVDIVCELISDSDTFISQEPFVKFVLLVLGKSIDDFISSEVEELFKKVQITEIPMNRSQESLDLDLDVYIDYLCSGIPDAFHFIGRATIKEVLIFLISSLQIERCNRDVFLQMFEFLSLRLMEDSSKNSFNQY